MRRILARVVGSVVVAVVAAGAVFVVGMRRHTPLVVDSVRRLARRTNRVPLKSAGTAGAYASVVRHVGRRTGRTFETPVRAVATADGFVVALPYGSTSDWVKNVIAAGTATIVQDGHAYRVDHPVVVPLSDAEGAFVARDRRAHRVFGVTECLTVRRATVAEAPPVPTRAGN